MKTIRLLGIGESVSGAHPLEIIECDVSVETGESYLGSNVELDDKFKASVKNIERIITEQYDFKKMFPDVKGLGVTFRVCDDELVTKLEDQSFGLPIYTAMIADLYDLNIKDNIFGTGVVFNTGDLSPVSFLPIKSVVIQDNPEAVFIYPSQMTGGYESESMISVSTARAGAMMWTGFEYGRHILPCIDDPAIFFQILVDMVEGHLNNVFIEELVGEIIRIAGSYDMFAISMRANKGRWLIDCLNNASQLNEEHFDSLTQLLDPLIDLDKVWPDPTLREDFIIETIDELADAAVEFPLQSARSGYSFLRIIRQGVDLALLWTTSIRLRHSIMRLEEEILQSPNAAVRKDEIGTAYNNIVRFVSDLDQAGSFVSGQPLHVESPILNINIIYDDYQFSALEFSMPDSPLLPPSRIDHPTALFDSSRSLPPALRRTDWYIDQSAYENLANAYQVSRRFGRNNSFIFPPFIKQGIETHIYWGDGTGTWPPSIDTLYLAGHLYKNGFYGRNVVYDRVLDLGCGTGVHGILLALNSRVKQLDFMDIEPGARLTTALNVYINFLGLGKPFPVDLFKKPVRYEFEGMSSVLFRDGRVDELVSGQSKYDLVICTPPYVPYLSILKDHFMWRAVAGTDLLRYVLKNCRRFSKRTVIQFSELALPEVEEFLGATALLGQQEVGFRIPPLLRYFEGSGDPRLAEAGTLWLEKVKKHLIDSENTNIEFVNKHHHGFKYFHRIRTYLIE